MVTQEQKTKWINQARQYGAEALIIYLDVDDQAYCEFIYDKDTIINEFNDLMDEGFDAIEEIFL